MSEKENENESEESGEDEEEESVEENKEDKQKDNKEDKRKDNKEDKQKDNKEDKQKDNKEDNKEDNQRKPSLKSEPQKVETKKILFDQEKVTQFWKNQKPPKKGLFIDQQFPPIAESLYDKKMKNEGVEKMNILQIDWRKSTELIKKKDLILFPNKKINSNEIDFQINFKDNEGELINNFSQFLHGIYILTKIPGLIQHIFRAEKANPDGYYELFIYTNGQYKILIIDDYFPIIKGTTILRFSKPVKNEIWLLLMEKAFAKVHGGYGALFSCDVSMVVQTFTGFPIERLNFYDMLDIEDLEEMIRFNKNGNFINLCPNKENCEEIGLMPGKAYQVEDIFDVRNNNNGKEECLKILKIKNLFEYNKYTGDWSSNGSQFTDTVKNILGYKSSDIGYIYISIEFAFKYFSQIQVIYPIFDTNVKLIRVTNSEKDESIMNSPQIFNLYIPFKSKVSMSLILRSNIMDMETTNFEQDFTGYEKMNPAVICFSQYDPESKSFKDFEGCFDSNNNPEICRELKKGYYLIWVYVLYDKCNDPKPDEYYIKVNSNTNFKLRHQAQDLKNTLLYNLLFNAINLNQGPFMKKDEIFYMNDNYYNFTGIGLKFVKNPFKDCYQIWTLNNQIVNMILLYPTQMKNDHEIRVGPDGSHLLIYGIRIDSKREGKFTINSIFKTIKLKENSQIKKNLSPPQINFFEFCSKDIKDEKITSGYYQYLSLSPILSEPPGSEEELLEKLNQKYPKQMKKINDLQLKISIKLDSQLKFKEIPEKDGTFIGQVNDKDEKNGRGAFILKESQNTIICYWDNNNMKGDGVEYDKDWNIVAEGPYENGNMNGVGMRIFEDGTKYEGLFIEGKMEGEGIYTFKDGSKWDGPSVKGKKEGKGMLTNPDGTKVTVEYKDDKRVGEEEEKEEGNEEEKEKEENEDNKKKENTKIEEEKEEKKENQENDEKKENEDKKETEEKKEQKKEDKEKDKKKENEEEEDEGEEEEDDEDNKGKTKEKEKKEEKKEENKEEDKKEEKNEEKEEKKEEKKDEKKEEKKDDEEEEEEEEEEDEK